MSNEVSRNIEDVMSSLNSEIDGHNSARDTEDLYDVEYVKGPPPEENKLDLDASSAVRGTLRRVEEDAAAAQGIRQNHSVLFLGMVCPIICEEDKRVQIRHGNNELWIPKESASKVLSSKERGRSEKWNITFRKPDFTAK